MFTKLLIITLLLSIPSLYAAAGPEYEEPDVPAFRFSEPLQSTLKNIDLGAYVKIPTVTKEEIGLFVSEILHTQSSLKSAFLYVLLENNQADIFENEIVKLGESPSASPLDQLNLGKLRYEQKDYPMAAHYYTLAAQSGHAAAQYKLGYMYGNGYGVERNDSEAVRFYRLAAAQGYATAQYNLGFMYYYGLRVERNYDEAVRFYRLAAEQGNARAQHNLGFMYEKGYGVDLNYIEAVRFYRLAADQALAEAQNNLGVMYKNGYGVERNYDEAVRFYRLAADQGNAPAQSNLGFMYEKGYGVERNYDEAVRFYRLAADQGNVMAQNNLKALERGNKCLIQ